METPETNTTDPALEAATSKIFELAQSVQTQQELPDLMLVEEKTKNWLSRLLSEYFNRKSTNVDPDFWNQAWTVVKYIGAAACVFLVLYLVYILVKWMRGPAPFAEAKNFAQPLLTDDVYQSEYEKALKEKNFARAARLRWHLYLSRTRQIHSKTPRETFNEAYESGYNSMFSGNATESDLAEHDRYLAAKENRSQ